MKNAIAKWESALPDVPCEAELEEVWESDGFGLFGEDEGLSADEMNQVGWRREMQSRDKDKISLFEQLLKDCLDKKPHSGRPKALTDTEINHLVVTVKCDFHTQRMYIVDIRREAKLSHVSDSTIWKSLQSRGIRPYRGMFKFILKSENKVVRLKYYMERKE
ncbi:hypothetical protein L873DRAFT_1902515 [Choiromyces venosus 120613-1]|uniref:Uncharacterized protein n=1 Tax=Choiromyces venosus 120613-1 TaxID=1336337 RepID=A0A3N4JNY4_9PEZI|nr:hypothetical protein L873DRAFT_1902515 [Choiromyces venosus 120613-1]